MVSDVGAWLRLGSPRSWLSRGRGAWGARALEMGRPVAASHSVPSEGPTSPSTSTTSLTRWTRDAGFSVQFVGYTSFRLLPLDDGSLEVTLTATCTDQDGNTVYLKAAINELGEPFDSASILWSFDPIPTNENSFIHDYGVSQVGNTPPGGGRAPA